MYVPIILGTAREGRRSENAARFVLEEVKRYGLETELIDVRDYRIKATDNTEAGPEAKRLAGKISRADGLIIVAPEYNHGYPGELKMLLDMLYKQYQHKPVGICGVSIGGLGGARCVEQLRQVVIELRMIPIREAIYFSNVGNLFDDKGGIMDHAFPARVKTLLDELTSYIKKQA